METRSSVIQERIKRMPEGAIVTFASLIDPVISPQALAVVISRLVKRGLLQKLSKGRYVKPRQTRFGTVLPTDNQVLESILKPVPNQLMGYVSGIAAYNRLGLTTQVPSEVLVAGPTSARKSKVGKLRIRFVRSKVSVTEDNKELLPILDAVRDVRMIPDASIDEVVIKVRAMISQLGEKEQTLLVEAARAYSPRVRAVVGAMFDLSGRTKLASVLKDTLNPISTYAIGISANALPCVRSWNIR